jgi:hypothetical protein
MTNAEQQQPTAVWQHDSLLESSIEVLAAEEACARWGEGMDDLYFRRLGDRRPRNGCARCLLEILEPYAAKVLSPVVLCIRCFLLWYHSMECLHLDSNRRALIIWQYGCVALMISIDLNYLCIHCRYL